MKDSKSVVCNKCGWGHFSVSKQYVKEWEADWIELFKTKPAEWLEMYGITDKPPSPDQYLHCFSCGNTYQDFREATEKDLKKLYGHTIQPVLDFKERWS